MALFALATDISSSADLKAQSSPLQKKELSKIADQALSQNNLECSDPKIIYADPHRAEEQFMLYSEDNEAEIIFDLAPGNYGRLTAKAPLKCLEVRCAVKGKCIAEEVSVLAWKSGTPGAKRFGKITIEGITFVGQAKQFGGSTDYGIRLYGVDAARISGNVFNGRYNHDISSKEANKYVEILDNRFIECERHCIEIGQNGNVPTRPSVSDTIIVRGNVFHHPARNALTQRYNRKLLVEKNTFINVGGNTVHNWPFWKRYDYGQDGGGELNRVPWAPLRTEIINNTLIGSNAFAFEGRGVLDDTILIKGNSGKADCTRTDMSDKTATAHADEKTRMPPMLDPASDIAC